MSPGRDGAGSISTGCSWDAGAEPIRGGLCQRLGQVLKLRMKAVIRMGSLSQHSHKKGQHIFIFTRVLLRQTVNQ